MASPVAAADPAVATAPRAMSRLLAPPPRDAPPPPVCGAPDGSVLVGEGLGDEVGVLVGVEVGVLVGVEVGESVGVLVGVEVGVLVGVEVGVAVGVAVGDAEVPVKYVPLLVTVTKIDCVYLTVPVPPGPFQQPIANSTVPPEPIPSKVARRLSLKSSVPLNPAVRPWLTTGEMRLLNDPLVLKSAIWADTWKPAGQPSVVDHVGCSEVAPVAGLRLRLPTSEPLAANANPAVSRPTPAIMPSAPETTTRRRSPAAARLMSLASLKGPMASLDTGIAANATALTSN